MAPARQLRCLVIHDSSLVETNLEVLGTSDLALCRLKSPDGEQYVLRSWTDLCEVLLGDLVVDSPDLVFCDANFEDDLNGPRLPAGTYDPRGLAYGAVMAAYFGGSGERRPFGFSPYSQNMSRAAEDPSAVAFYGILKAMAHDSPSLHTPVVLRAELAGIPAGQKPDAVIPVALHMFRTSLLDLALAVHWVRPDFESIEVALTEVQAAIVANTTPESHLGISWSGYEGHLEAVLLTSLFADYRAGGTWKNGQLREVVTYLEKLLKGREVRLRRLQAARAQVDYLCFSGTATTWSSGHEGNWERVLTYAAIWALEVCRVNANDKTSPPPSSNPAAVLKKIDSVLPDPYKYMTRALETVFGKNTRPTVREFLDTLAESQQWPFPSVPDLKWAMTTFLTDRYDNGKGHKCCDTKFWPACLR